MLATQSFHVYTYIFTFILQEAKNIEKYFTWDIYNAANDVMSWCYVILEKTKPEPFWADPILQGCAIIVMQRRNLG